MRKSTVISNFHKEEKDNQEIDTLEKIICITLKAKSNSVGSTMHLSKIKATGNYGPSPHNSMAEPSRKKKVNCMTYQL